VKRLLAALLLVASPALSQSNGWREIANGWGEIQTPPGYSTFPAPATCTTAGQIPVFLGSPLALGCDAGLTYTAATQTLAAERVAATSYSAVPKTVTITGATNATPIVVTATAHGLQTSDWITISGITGNTNANGFFKVTRLTADTFSLQNYSTGAYIAGNGAYGGTPVAVTGIVYGARSIVGDGTLAQPAQGFAGYPALGPFRDSSSYSIVQDGARLLTVGGLSTKVWTSRFQIYNSEVQSSSSGVWSWGGPASATPTAQSHRSQSGTGTNVAAGALTIGTGTSTGNATPPVITFVTTARGTSGTGAQADVNRLTLGANGTTFTTDNGAQWVRGQATELITLSTSGTTTDSSADLLPANSIIESVVLRVTTTITTATDWKAGDATTPGRFTTANGTRTAGTTDIGLVHVDQAGAAGPRQTSAAKLRITTTGTPGAGAVRATVFYRQFVPPTT